MNLKNCSTDKLFSRLIDNKTNKNAWLYISELFKRPSEAVFQKCVHLSQSHVINERIIGINVLSQLGSDKRPFQKETVILLFEILKKEDNPKIIRSILSAIGHNSEKLNSIFMKQLEKYKESRNSDIRFGLVIALLHCKHKNAEDILIFLSKDKHSDIRDWATYSIGSISESNNPTLLAALWDRVNDKDEDTRFEAFVGLAKRKQVEVKVNIMKELEKGNYGSLLFDAISELNHEDFLPYLESLLVEYKNDGTVNSGWMSDLEDCIAVLKK